MNSIQSDEYFACKKDFNFFCKNYVKITNNTRKLVPFELYEFQKNIIEKFKSNNHIICKSYRRSGMTTLTSIYCLWESMFHEGNTIIVCPKENMKINVMTIIRAAWLGLPDWMKSKGTKIFDRKSIIFEDDSRLILCDHKNFERTFQNNNFTTIIFDDAAFSDEIKKSYDLTLSIPKIKTIINSCPNGKQNWFSDVYHDAVENFNEFEPISLNYQENPMYDPDMIENAKRQLDERSFVQEIIGEFA